MFIGKYDLNGETQFAIYYKNKYGYKAWCEETFSPCVGDIEILDFKIEGDTYKEKQASLEDLAITWQTQYSTLSWSYGELATIGDFFYRNGKRYGLLKEFRENAIC